MKKNAWSPRQRGLIEHIRKMNKNGKRCYPPSPWGLYNAILEWADFNTGLCNLSIKEMAWQWGTSRNSLRRALEPLFEKGYLVRLFPKRPLFFVKKFLVWRENQWQRLDIKKKKSGIWEILVVDKHGSYTGHVLFIDGSYTGHVCPNYSPPAGHVSETIAHRRTIVPQQDIKTCKLKGPL